MKSLLNLDCLRLNVKRFPCELVSIVQVMSELTSFSDFVYISPTVGEWKQGDSIHFVVEGTHAKKGQFKFKVQYRRGAAGEFGSLNWSMLFEGSRQAMFGSGKWAYVLDSHRIDKAYMMDTIIALNFEFACIDNAGGF